SWLPGFQPMAFANEFTLTQRLSAVASGEGAPDGLFGWDVGVEADLAVACDVRLDGSPARIRTFARNGAQWQRLPAQDIVLPGDSGCRLSLEQGTLVVSGYRSTAPSRGYLRIYARVADGWDQEYALSFPNVSFDAVATSGNIAVVGEPLYAGAAGQNEGRIRILRRAGNGDWSSQFLTSAQPEVGALFGASVAIVSGAIAVGAPRKSRLRNGTSTARAGATFVYELTQNTWNLAATLDEVGANIGTDHRFGAAVAISGADTGTPDRLLISSPSNQSTGRVGIVRSYRRISGTWTAGFTVAMPTPSSTDQFGCTLALDGDWAVIGTCASSTAAAQAGAVQIARFSSNFDSLLQLTQRVDPLAATNDFLGSRIGIDREGPTVIVGNLQADLYGNENQGVVLVGRSQSGEVPSLVRAMDLGQGLTNAYAGAVAVDADTAVIGAYQETVGSQSARGAAYVYRRSLSGQYALEARLLAPDGLTGDSFGFSVAVRGDVILVGAVGRGQAGIEAAGAVYVFRRTGSAWALEALLTPAAPAANNSMGLSLAFDGSTALIGERRDHVAVYQRTSAGAWSVVQSIFDRGDGSLALSGDFAALGFPDAQINGAFVGKAAIYRRAAGLWTLDDTFTGSVDGQGFGDEVSLDGNLLAVSNRAYQTPALLYRRSGNGWLPEDGLLPADLSATTRCHHVAVSGDLAAIGCWDQPAAVLDGFVYVFEKTPSGWTQIQKINSPVTQTFDSFGYSVAWLGSNTLFAGALGHTIDFSGQGAVYVYAADRIFRNGFD
ncbi:MAG: hypothetical protein ABI650_04105, partial [Dokdonella sp.]